MYNIRNIATGFILLGLSSCITPPDYPDEPVINFKSLSQSSLLQGGQESFQIKIGFTDGDGDLGITENDVISWTTPAGIVRSDTGANVFLIDSRTGFVEYTYRVPSIPQQGASNGISGDIDVDLASSCCIYQDGSLPCTPNVGTPQNTMYYDIIVVDKAGHVSNTTRTSAITLICN